MAWRHPAAPGAWAAPAVKRAAKPQKAKEWPLFAPPWKWRFSCDMHVHSPCLQDSRLRRDVNQVAALECRPVVVGATFGSTGHRPSPFCEQPAGQCGYHRSNGQSLAGRLQTRGPWLASVARQQTAAALSLTVVPPLRTAAAQWPPAAARRRPAGNSSAAACFGADHGHLCGARRPACNARDASRRQRRSDDGVCFWHEADSPSFVSGAGLGAESNDGRCGHTRSSFRSLIIGLLQRCQPGGT